MCTIKRFSASFKGVPSEEIDNVLAMMLRSFNVVSTCIQKSKRDGGITKGGVL